MSRYEVIDPKGVSFGGVQIPQGEFIEVADARSNPLASFLHFNQVKLDEGKKAKPEVEKQAESKSKK